MCVCVCVRVPASVICTHTHKEQSAVQNCVMARHGNAEETDSARPIQYSTSDIIITFTPAPTLFSLSSFSYSHRSMGFCRNQTFTFVADSVRSIDYSVSDIIVFTPAPTPHSCSSISHVHRFMSRIYHQSRIYTFYIYPVCERLQFPQTSVLRLS